MNFEIANPRKSCARGGRKVYMVFTSPIPQDTEPIFQLFSRNGLRLQHKEYLLSQPNDPRDFLVLMEAIILITPYQENLDVIFDNDWIIKLAARRQSTGVESINSFEFSYLTHPMDTLCIFCNLNLD